MSSILELFSSNSGAMIAVLFALVLILGGIAVNLSMGLGKTKRNFRQMLNGSTGADLEQVLIEHTEARMKLEKRLIEAESRIETLERKLQKSKRHVGIVRYDAFQDVGGLQSFAMAIYDDNGDGVVLSSIIGRAEGRVYGKPILGGKSDRNLTNEEQQAIVEAVSSSPKSVVSGA